MCFCPLSSLRTQTGSFSSVSPVPSPEPGLQQLPEQKLGASQSQPFPSWQGWYLEGHSLKGRGCWAVSSLKPFQPRWSVVGICCLSCPKSVPLLPGGASGLSFEASAASTRSLWFGWDWTPGTTQGMGVPPRLGATESPSLGQSLGLRWARDPHQTSEGQLSWSYWEQEAYSH